MPTIVLVEGVTDQRALALAARRCGRDLAAEGVTIVPINGAHALGRHLRRLAAEEPGARLAGLYDAGEERVVAAALERAGRGAGLDRGGLEAAGFFACRADLEEELVRAAGEAGVDLSRLAAAQGDAQPWRTFRSQPAWRARPEEEQFRRFIRSVSERNGRYIGALVEALEPAALPRPLRLLLDHVRPAAAGGE